MTKCIISICTCEHLGWKVDPTEVNDKFPIDFDSAGFYLFMYEGPNPIEIPQPNF